MYTGERDRHAIIDAGVGSDHRYRWIYSNSRKTDAKETLRAEMATGNSRITDIKETLRAQIATGFTQVRADFNERFNSIDRKLDEILRMVADHDTRLRSVEERRH